MTRFDHNRRAWDRRAEKAQRFARPIADDEFQQRLSHLDPAGWLEGRLRGARLLCLAAGGGRHGPLYAAAGADVTVVDFSAEQLVLDREVAASRQLKLRTIQASMDALDALADRSFDVVIQPVSTCYVPDIQRAYHEVARILCPGGIYVSQHKQPASLQASHQPNPSAYTIDLPWSHRGPLPDVAGSLHREEGTLEYLHCWQLLLGGMCRAGFVIEDLLEPDHTQPHAAPGTFAHRSRYLPPYVRVKARRTTLDTHRAAPPTTLHLPGDE